MLGAPQLFESTVLKRIKHSNYRRLQKKTFSKWMLQWVVPFPGMQGDQQSKHLLAQLHSPTRPIITKVQHWHLKKHKEGKKNFTKQARDFTFRMWRFGDWISLVKTKSGAPVTTWTSCPAATRCLTTCNGTVHQTTSTRTPNVRINGNGARFIFKDSRIYVLHQSPNSLVLFPPCSKSKMKK